MRTAVLEQETLWMYFFFVGRVVGVVCVRVRVCVRASVGFRFWGSDGLCEGMSSGE